MTNGDRQKPQSIEPMTLQGLTFTAVTAFEQMKPYAAEWNDLAARSPLRLPMLSFAWVASYLEHRLAAGESWMCLFAHDQATLVGVFPLIRSRPSPVKRHPHLRVPYPADILIAPGRERDVLPPLLAYLDRLCPDRSELHLQRIHHRSPSMALPAGGLTGDRVVRDFDGYGAYIDTTGNFEAFQNRLHGNFRRNLQKGARRLGALGITQLVTRSADALAADDLETFIKIEGSGWKGRTGSAIMRTSSKEAYYRALTRRLTELGWLHWFFLELDDKPIAGLLAVRLGDTLVFEKMGYDEEYAACSPGHLLFERILRYIFDDGEIKEINCLSHDPWISSWRTDKRPYYNLHLFPHRARSTLFGYIPRRVRAALRRLI